MAVPHLGSQGLPSLVQQLANCVLMLRRVTVLLMMCLLCWCAVLMIQLLWIHCEQWFALAFVHHQLRVPQLAMLLLLRVVVAVAAPTRLGTADATGVLVRSC